MPDTVTTDNARPGLLALDLGTRSGWAMRTNLGTVAHGFIDLKGGRFEGGGMRFLRFGRWLDQLHQASPVTEVAFEEVRRHLGVDAAHVYGGLMATLTAWCEQQGLPYSGIPVGTIKRAVTGSGNAGKDRVIEAVRARGFEVTDDNAADAIALLLTVEGAP